MSGTTSIVGEGNAPGLQDVVVQQHYQVQQVVVVPQQGKPAKHEKEPKPPKEPKQHDGGKGDKGDK